jgi:hypothetical protein
MRGRWQLAWRVDGGTTAAAVAGVARVDRRVVGDEQGDVCERGQHPTDDQNGGGRE